MSPIPPPPGTRLDAYGDHYPIAITAQIVDIGDPDLWRIVVKTWRYDEGTWKRLEPDDSGLTMTEVLRLFEYVRARAPEVLP